MNEWLGPLRSAIRVDVRRRATLALGIATLAVLGLTVYGSYSTLRDQRHILAQLQRGDVFINFNTGCDATGCHFIGPDGRPFGPELSPADYAALQTIQSPPPSSPQGGPSGPPDFATQTKVLTSLRPLFEVAQRDFISQFIQVEYAPRRIFSQRARSLGSLWGIVPAVLLGATLFGAEWRWSVWRTQLSHEPRRGRVLLGKLVALWGLIAAAFALLLALGAGADVIFRLFEHIGAHGGSSVPRLLGQAARPLVGIEFYATLAAAFAVFLRSSLAGLGGPLVLVLGDGLLTRRYEWLRVFLPTQQVAWLLPRPEAVVVGGGPWWPLITDKISCNATTGHCMVKVLQPIPQPRALLVLGAWIVAAVVWAWAMLRIRDVPQ